MSSSTSANYWQTETIKAISNMFEEQVDEETISAFFEENENDIERTVDAILVHLNKVEEAKKEEEKRSKTIEDLLEFEEIPEEIEVSQISQSEVDYSQAESINVKESNYSDSLASSSSTNNSVLIYEVKPDFTLSEMETQTEYNVTTPEEKTVQTEELLLSPDLRRFQDRIEELSLNLSESKLAAIRVEEEKKNAMKWCVTEMEALRYTVSEKDKIIVEQQEEIEKLKMRLSANNNNNKPAPEDNKLDKFIVESKQMIVESVQTLSQQLSENITKIQKEFKKADDKEWIVVEKLKEFAADFRREISELFKDPITNPFKKMPKKVAPSPVVPVPSRESQLQRQLEEERQLWQTEKASLETYIKELERQIKVYKDYETAEDDKYNIAMVVSQTDVSEAEAREAYLRNNKDVFGTISELKAM